MRPALISTLLLALCACESPRLAIEHLQRVDEVKSAVTSNYRNMARQYSLDATAAKLAEASGVVERETVLEKYADDRDMMEFLTQQDEKATALEYTVYDYIYSSQDIFSLLWGQMTKKIDRAWPQEPIVPTTQPAVQP